MCGDWALFFGSGFVWLHNTVVGIIDRLVFFRLEEALKIRSNTLEPQSKGSIKVRSGYSWPYPGQLWASSGMEFSLPLWAAVLVLGKFDDTHVFLIFLGISHVAVCVHCPSAFKCVYLSLKCGSLFFMIPLGHLRNEITASQAFPSQVWKNPAQPSPVCPVHQFPTTMVILSLMSSSWPCTGGQKVLHVQALLCWGEKYSPGPTDCVLAHAAQSVAQLH